MNKMWSQKAGNSSGGTVVWLTELSGAGKTTLVDIIAGEFQRRQLTVEVLDDVIRRNLSKPPEQPEVVVRTPNESPDESAKRIVNWLEKRGRLT